MNRYKQEVDALHAPDTLKNRIAALPNETRPAKKPIRRIAAIAAVLAVVLLAGIVTMPALFSAEKSTDRNTESYENYSTAKGYDYGYDDAFIGNDVAESGYEYADGAAAPVGTGASPALPSGRKLIRDAELSVETTAFDDFCAAVQKKTAALEGYVESSESGASGSLRYARLVLRIPADSLDVFLQNVAELGTVTSQSTSVQDVTDRYIDVKSRIAALETEQETLLELLKKAEDLSEILEIQDRLTEVRGSLESYKAQLQALDSRIDYSAVTMHVSEVDRVTPQESKSFSTQLRQNLSENLYSIGQGARSFALWFLSSLPNIALWLILIGVLIGVVRLVRKKRRGR